METQLEMIGHWLMWDTKGTASQGRQQLSTSGASLEKVAEWLAAKIATGIWVHPFSERDVGRAPTKATRVGYSCHKEQGA